MTKATLTRAYTDTQTLGELEIGESKFVTIGTLNFIPNGVYNVTVKHDPKYGGHFQITKDCRIIGGKFGGFESRNGKGNTLKKNMVIGASIVNGDVHMEKPTLLGMLMIYPNGFELTIK